MTSASQFVNEEPFRIFSKTKTDLPIKLTAFYYEKPTHIELSGQSGYILVNGHERYFLNGGYVRLTKVGQELAAICGSTPDDDFRNYVVTQWKK